ncbi:MAG: hypothetical protein J5842_00155, partial [Lachnospiraceae bacterium]|nr:hypothetical protein [Lachnospiraceae bacterium]
MMNISATILVGSFLSGSSGAFGFFTFLGFGGLGFFSFLGFLAFLPFLPESSSSSSSRIASLSSASLAFLPFLPFLGFLGSSSSSSGSSSVRASKNLESRLFFFFLSSFSGISATSAAAFPDIAYHGEGELVSFTVLKIRQGKLLGRENYRAESLNDDDDLIAEFMAVFYDDIHTIPPQVYIPQTSEYDHISRWLHEEKKATSEVIMVASRDLPRDVAAIQMAKQNAKEDIVRRLRDRGDTPAMEELKEKLGLDTLPVRIEGFDIAHIGGKWPVASLISFYNGNPDKKNYRYFRLKTTDGLIDDFASMKEAVSRRYSRLLNEQAEMPDLLLIDGGIGQVNAVEEILNSLGLDIPVAGLAKRDEEIYRPGNSTPICLPKRSDALRLLQRVRDETHRFATSRNQRLRTKENTKSIFLELPGVG